MTTSSTLQQRRPPIEASLLGFEAESPPPVWFAGNPFLTHFMNAFSAILPEGERFMIRCVRAARVALPADSALHADLAGFIGQEAQHAREHHRVNAQQGAHGLPIAALEAEMARAMRRLDRLPERQRLAITGATEHLTALFGEMLLRHPEVVEQAHPAYRPLLIWHSLEELEHKAVAFDLHAALEGRYGERAVGLLRASAVIGAQVLRGQWRLMRADGSIHDLRAIGAGLWWMFGFGRGSGYLRRAIPGYLRFFRPGFHPSESNSALLIEAWQPRLERMRTARAEAAPAA